MRFTINQKPGDIRTAARSARPAVDMENVFAAQAQQRLLLLHKGNTSQLAEICHLLTATLKYDVMKADGAQEAVRVIQSGTAPPDAVLVDMTNLPDADQVVADIIGVKKQLPVIVLVGYGDYQQAAESLLMGAHDFITKPFSKERIAVTLRNTLAFAQSRCQALSRQFASHDGQNPDNKHTTPAAAALISLVNEMGDIRKMEEIEKAAINYALRFYNGRMSLAARKLGIGRSTLYRKRDVLERYNGHRAEG